MNAGMSNDDPSVHYYDGDYPSPWGEFPENFDETTKFQGLAFDIQRYEEIAQEVGSPVLELCCGTGRVAIPLAHAGHDVVGVDVSAGMLTRFARKLQGEPPEIRDRVHLHEADITKLDLAQKNFPLAIVPFNSLLCIADFQGQRAALSAIGKHLKPSGRLALDIVNPLKLRIDGDSLPKPFFTRRNPHTGNEYTRFAAMGSFDTEQRQRLHGWYDEITTDGTVLRKTYALYWRPIFRFEAELMLNEAGFDVLSIEGGHQHEPYSAESPRMFILAKRS